MGYIKHSAVIVTAALLGRERLPTPVSPGMVVAKLRERLAEAGVSDLDLDVADLVVGPRLSATNSYVSWALLPDGSKEGWSTSDAGDLARGLFPGVLAALYREAGWSFYPEAVEVHFGQDYGSEVGATATVQEVS